MTFRISKLSRLPKDVYETSTLDLGIVTAKRFRKGDRHRNLAVKRELLRCAEDLWSLDEHEWGIERLHAELARELDPRARDVARVVRVAPGDEEVALRGERNARVVHPCDFPARQARVAEAPTKRGGGRVELRYEHGVVGVRVADGLLDTVEAREAGPSAVRDEDLAVGEVEELVQGTVREHVVDFPALGNALGGERNSGALGTGRHLTREVLGWSTIIDGGATTYQSLGSEIRRRERKEDGRPVGGVRDTHAIRNVRKRSLSVCFDVVDDRLVVGDHEDPPIGEREDTDRREDKSQLPCIKWGTRTGETGSQGDSSPGTARDGLSPPYGGRTRCCSPGQCCKIRPRRASLQR